MTRRAGDDQTLSHEAPGQLAEVLPVDILGVGELFDELSIVEVPDLKMVEEDLLQGVAEIAKHDLDLGGTAGIATMEVEFVRQPPARPVRRQHTVETLDYVRAFATLSPGYPYDFAHRGISESGKRTLNTRKLSCGAALT